MQEAGKSPIQNIIDGAVPPKAKPFPYYPPIPSEEQDKRMEVMMELNKWAYNDPMLAKRAAETLIVLLSNQFDINLLQCKE